MQPPVVLRLKELLKQLSFSSTKVLGQVWKCTIMKLKRYVTVHLMCMYNNNIIRTVFQRTPLGTACFYGQASVVQLLLDSGSKVDPNCMKCALDQDFT